MELCTGGHGIRRAALLAPITATALMVSGIAASAEPKTTPASEPPDPTTATTPCVRADRCAPIGSITVDPNRGMRSTDIDIAGSCGRTSATPSLAAFISFGQSSPRIGPVYSREGGAYADFDERAGTFAQRPNPHALFAERFAFRPDLYPPGLYYFAAECWLYPPDTGTVFYLDREDYLFHWLTPPGRFCLYAVDDDPAGCTSTPGFEDLAHQFGAWGFFSGMFIGQIGAQFTPPAAPEPAAPLPDVTTTTRRRTTPATTPPVIVPPPPPEVTTTTTLKPCVGKGCP